MVRNSKKRIFAARLLLSVFLPMLLCVSLHTHQQQDMSEIPCYECAHHLHHSGHFTATHGILHACLLCQLSKLPLLPIALAALPACAVIKVFPVFRNAQHSSSDAWGCHRLRGPPTV